MKKCMFVKRFAIANKTFNENTLFHVTTLSVKILSVESHYESS